MASVESHVITHQEYSCTHPLSLFIEDDDGKLVFLADKVFVPYKQLEGILPYIQQRELSSVVGNIIILL